MATISKEVNIDILEKLPDGTFKKKNPSTTIENISKLREELDSLEHEAGSNDDGYWLKLPDGTLLCQHVVFWDVQTKVSGSIHEFLSPKWEFPHEFSDRPHISSSMRGSEQIGDSPFSITSRDVQVMLYYVAIRYENIKELIR